MPGIPSLPLARGLLILALVQIGLKNKKIEKKKKRERKILLNVFSSLPFSTLLFPYVLE